MPRVSEKQTKSVIFAENGTFFVPNVPDTMLDKIIGALGGKLMMANWIYPLMSLKGLPTIVPLVFNVKGHIRITTAKYLLLCVPVLSTLSLVKHFHTACDPEAINYPVKINSKNARKVYSLGKSFSRMRGVVAQCIFLGVSMLMIESFRSNDDSKRNPFSLSVIGMIAASVLGYGTLHYLFGKSKNAKAKKQKRRF